MWPNEWPITSDRELFLNQWKNRVLWLRRI